jgi:hypothetical protein
MIYKHKINGKKYEYLGREFKMVKLKSVETENILLITETNFDKFYKKI